MLKLFGAPCADAGSGLKKITGEKEPTQPEGKETKQDKNSPHSETEVV